MVDDESCLVWVVPGIRLKTILGAFAAGAVWLDHIQLGCASESLDPEFVHCPRHLIWVFLCVKSKPNFIVIQLGTCYNYH